MGIVGGAAGASLPISGRGRRIMRTGGNASGSARCCSRQSLGAASGSVAVVMLLAGCAGDGAAAAEEAVHSFQQALGSDPERACDLLAPATVKELEETASTACPVALQEADLPGAGIPQHTDIAGHSARVVLDSDTVFLALFDDGWRITAAGCSPSTDVSLPHDCTVKGA